MDFRGQLGIECIAEADQRAALDGFPDRVDAAQLFVVLGQRQRVSLFLNPEQPAVAADFIRGAPIVQSTVL